MTTECSTIRSVIDQIVSTIEPFDPLEAEHIKFARSWIQSADEIFRIAKPATPDTHLVSYFAVISPSEDKILLVDHKMAKLWLPPGGHVEVNEHPKETVEREIREELGTEADFLLESPLFLTLSKTADTRANKGHTDVSLWYVLRGSSDIHLDFDKSEFKQIRWFGMDEIPFQKTDPHLQRFLAKLRKYNLL